MLISKIKSAYLQVTSALPSLLICKNVLNLNLLNWEIVLILACSFEKKYSSFLLIWKKCSSVLLSSVLNYDHLSPSCSSSFKSRIYLACSKICAYLPFSPDKKCSSGLFLWKASAQLPFSSGKKCLSGLLIWKNDAHLCCSSEKKCSTHLALLRNSPHLSLLIWKKCSSLLLIWKKMLSHLAQLCSSKR